MKTKAPIAVFLVGLFTQITSPHGAETDQFLAMEIELEDSGPALNRYLNEQALLFLEKENARRSPTENPDKLAREYYYYLFKGLFVSRLRSWVFTSDEIDRYPDLSVKYFEHYRLSIYDMRSFPFFMPMARTVRVGDVHFGMDKFGHFLGFGRRGYKQFLRYRERGLTEEEALEKLIRYWLFSERYLVGNLVDGIYSYADLEANYQGLRMIRALGEGEDAHFKKVDGQWVLDRPIDIVPYITPDFDETYNRSHYSFTRKNHVYKVLCPQYYDKLSLPIVQERFARYDTYPRSLCREVTDRYYAEREKDPREVQDLDCMCEELNLLAEQEDE
jgi:hypothetical protein